MMSGKVEEEQTSIAGQGEGSVGLNANGKASGEAQASRKTEKRPPKKLGGLKPQATQQEVKDVEGGASPEQEDNTIEGRL